MTARMVPLEPWPELGEFIRELVRAEVDARETASADQLIDGIKKLVAREVDEAMDGLMEEILATVGGGAPRAAPAPKPAPRRRGRPPEEWITAKRAARIAGVRPSTMLTWIRRGHLKRYGTMRRVLVSNAELRRLIKAGGAARLMNGHAP